MENVIARNNMENFILGGNCTFTLSSKRTNNYYVYNIKANKEKTVYFVTVKDYNADVYAGYIKRKGEKYIYVKGGKGAYDMNDNRILSLMWFMNHIRDNDIEAKIVLQHNGKCCKCGRTLTDPISIERGCGPECAKIVFGK